jgi:hypothetical protein
LDDYLHHSFLNFESKESVQHDSARRATELPEGALREKCMLNVDVGEGCALR